MLKTPTGQKIQALAPRLLQWFSDQARDLPWRNTCDPYAIWISEIMLQQTQVKTVIPYWQRWLRTLPNVTALAHASPEKILKLWEGLGYYSRARNLQKAAQIILTESGGRFPVEFAAVLALPGIGRYTAGAICSIAFNQPVPILDGNVVRVLTRLFGIGTDPREKATNTRLWQLAEQLVRQSAQIPLAGTTTHPRAPAGHCSQLNQSLMELGALVCTPRQPRCDLCPVRRACTARKRNLIEQIPCPRSRPPAIQRHVAAFVAEQNGRFLVRQRPPGTINAGLWEFPNQDVTGGEIEPLPLAQNLLGMDDISVRPLCVIKHSITRYRIQLNAFHASLPVRAQRPTGQWLTPDDLQPLAFASAHRKILQQLLARR